MATRRSESPGRTGPVSEGALNPDPAVPDRIGSNRSQAESLTCFGFGPRQAESLTYWSVCRKVSGIAGRHRPRLGRFLV
jgi:hypothetical protein